MKIVHTFWCETCNPPPNSGKAPAMSFEETKQHLKRIHKINGRWRGKKQLVSAMEGDQFCNTYQVTVRGVKLTQVVIGEP